LTIRVTWPPLAVTLRLLCRRPGEEIPEQFQKVSTTRCTRAELARRMLRLIARADRPGKARAMTEAARRQALVAAQSGQAQTLTLLDLVAAIVDSGANESEVVATVTRLVNQGRVRLVGNFRGADVRIG
jgi:hypothetical protein